MSLPLTLVLNADVEEAIAIMLKRQTGIFNFQDFSGVAGYVYVTLRRFRVYDNKQMF
jgi:hypothetical protein